MMKVEPFENRSRRYPHIFKSIFLSIILFMDIILPYFMYFFDVR